MCETCVKVFERVVPTVVGVVGAAVYSGCGKAVGFVAVL